MSNPQREAWLAGWYAYRDDESGNWQLSREQVEAQADKLYPETRALRPHLCGCTFESETMGGTDVCARCHHREHGSNGCEAPILG